MLIRVVYTAVLYLAIPFIILRLHWKGRRLPAYRQRLTERFSLGKMDLAPVDVWVHAVSLGEVVAASPLIQNFLNRGWRVMVTTMTPTGSHYVVQRFGSRVAHQYLPYDLPWVLRRFFKKIKPKIGLIMETELWPNLIHQAHAFKFPLLLINARLSDRAFKQYYRVRFLFKPILNQLTRILAQSEEDARRFKALGALPSHVEKVGNIKFDIKLVPVAERVAPIGPMQWGEGRVVVMAASTHEGEEIQLLNDFPILQRTIPRALLLLAPRHPERFQTVHQLCEQSTLKTARRSQPESIDPDVEVIVLDSLGELPSFYPLSDYAFIGGSIVPIGGHNVLEAIVDNVPVFCGPYMNNSQSICDELQDAFAIERVLDGQNLMMKVTALHQNPERRKHQIAQANAVLEANKGALARCLTIIDEILMQE